jgi:hypothetical protein
MISDRGGRGDGVDRNPAGPRYFVSDGTGDLHNIDSWESASTPATSDFDELVSLK